MLNNWNSQNGKSTTFSMVAIALLMSFVYNARSKTRDPYKWPFDQSSIWNMPIHNNAQYVFANIQTTQRYLIDEDIILMTPNAPVREIKQSNATWNAGADRCQVNGGTLFTAPIPDDFVYRRGLNYLGNTPNSRIAVLSTNGTTIKQSQPFARCDPGGIGTSRYNFADQGLYSEGIVGAHGGSGLSAIGGAIRYGEFTEGIIRHALKLNLYGRESISRTGGGYRWPAWKADGGYNSSSSGNYYNGSVPACKMGALLAVRPQDYDALISSFETGSSPNSPAVIMARALRDYGGYIVDNTAWDASAFVTGFSNFGRVHDEFEDLFGYGIEANLNNSGNSGRWARDLERLFKSLYVVDNNTDGNTGGGPDASNNRRVSKAPDFGNPGCSANDEMICNGSGPGPDPDPDPVGTGAELTIYVAAKDGTESMEVKVDGIIESIVTGIGGNPSSRVFEEVIVPLSSSPSTIEISLMNDNGGSRDLRIDKIDVCGTEYQTENAQASGICPNTGGEWLWCNGTFTYSVTNTCNFSTPDPDPDPVEYNLVVNSGIGDGIYEEGEVVNITADAAPSGQVFDSWTGNNSAVADVNDPTTTITMPASNVTINATYEDEPTTACGSFSMMIEAEASGNTLSGAARLNNKSAASGGQVVGYLGNGASNYLDINNVNVPCSGNYSMLVDYISGQTRTVYIRVNGGSSFTESVNSGSWNSVSSFTRVISLNAGNNVIRFFNDGNWAPDIDKITLTLVDGAPAPTPTTYILTVNNGSGDGNYETGEVVNISANNAPSGQEFDAWTGNTAGVADINDPTTTLTMPSSNATITATYQNISNPDPAPASELKIYVAAKDGSENMQVKVDGVTVSNITGIGGNPSSRVFEEIVIPLSSSPSTIQVGLTNDNGSSRDLRVDKIDVCGTIYESENAQAAGICPNTGGEWFWCNGTFTYSITNTCDGSGVTPPPPPPPSGSSGTVKIMPLGDSNTAGSGGASGAYSYRGNLYKRAVNDGFDIDFVGPNKANINNGTNGDHPNNFDLTESIPDPDHAGYGAHSSGPDNRTACWGYFSNCKLNLYDNINVIMAEDPDIVLLMLGTNISGNTNNAAGVQQEKDRLKGLVNRILQIKPSCLVLFGGAPVSRGNLNSGYGHTRAAALEIGTLSSTDNIYYVDLKAANLQYNDFTDNVHLTQGGAAKIAGQFYAVLKPILQNWSSSRYVSAPTKPESALSLYPNPASQIVHFTQEVSGAVFNSMGARVRVLSNTRSIDISDLKSGLYHVVTSDRKTLRLMID